MGGAIMFRPDPERESEDDKDDGALLLGSEEENPKLPASAHDA